MQASSKLPVLYLLFLLSAVSDSDIGSYKEKY